ncbi:ABC transporter substrate-binding protein [Bacillus sp. JJ1562]|uniref:ABC transporter substrate-binding protein n=1 Tax=Bacillus sp. JJ1562 TaxID=3122960 RepID=UPI003001ABB1
MHKIQIKFMFRLFLLVVLMFVVVGCSSESNVQEKNNTDKTTDTVEADEGTPKKGGEVVFAYETDVTNLDPIKGSHGNDHAFLWPIFDTLIKFSPELEPEPGLAESWDFPDDKTIVLTLREGVTFHDGTPFDAEAVKFNIERVNSDDSKVVDFEKIESVEVVDEKTVKLNLSEPDSSLLLAFSDRGGMMVSPTAIKESGDDFSQNPVGAGPYKMVKSVPNGEVIYEPYEDYWQEGKPYLDKMTIKIMADENTRINALKSGEVDYAHNISPENIPSLEKESEIVLKEIMAVPFRLLYVNASKAPLDNKAVRQAIMYGINREALIGGITFGIGEPAYQPFPKDYWAADKDIKIAYDPEKAKQLLKEAGVDNVSFEMNHYSTAYEQKLAEAIKGQLSEIGIQVDLNAMDAAAAGANYFTEKDAQVLVGRWTGRPDPLMTINNLFGGDSYYNAGSYTTPEIEKLISEAASSYDQDELAKIYGEISNKAVLEEAIMIPMFFTPKVAAMNTSIKGYEPNMIGKEIFSTIWKEQ